MKKSASIFVFTNALLFLPAAGFAAPETKGQHFDRIVYEAAEDANVVVTVRIMTVNRFADSAAKLTVTDNGSPVYGPEIGKTERWTRDIAIRGGGRHEVSVRCEPLNAQPVYCSATLNQGAARVIE